MKKTTATPPELWNTYSAYVNYCVGLDLPVMSLSAWNDLHAAYLARQPKTADERIATLERQVAGLLQREETREAEL